MFGARGSRPQLLVPRDLFDDLLAELHSRFTERTYSLLHNNCNHFTKKLVAFLLQGKKLPDEINGISE